MPNIINAVSSKSTSNDVLVIDNENIYDGQLDVLNKMNLGYTFQIATENMTIDQAKEKVENGDVGACINLTRGETGINMDYIIKSTSLFNADNSTRTNAGSNTDI